MQKRTFATLVGVLGLGLGAGFAPAASSTPNPNKDLCKDGGWAQSPLSQLNFPDPGQCIAYFNHGGTVPGGYGV